MEPHAVLINPLFCCAQRQTCYLTRAYRHALLVECPSASAVQVHLGIKRLYYTLKMPTIRLLYRAQRYIAMQQLAP
jgi:hypothetical protein